MRVRLISSDRNLAVGSVGNAGDRNKNFEKRFAYRTGVGSSKGFKYGTCVGSSGVQKNQYLTLMGPETQRWGTVQVKAKTKTSSHHFRDGMRTDPSPRR